MFVKDCIAFPMTDGESGLDLRRALFNTGAVWHFTQPCLIGFLALITAGPGLTAKRPKIATRTPVSVNQLVNPLPTDSDSAAHSRHHTDNLIRTPVFANQTADLVNE
ncbi:hypothetical protein AU14_12630 [Marinobacter similis]|uniref:Uncharacterized protein n=1 Tax=Marinobacter similis TaxID=1420916 RepID=W5YM06_9GAMM|nr:hypothetical protein AU14_12630 [Marinobacter similis]